MAAISNRCPDVTVEYDDATGNRVTKHFEDAHKAKRFYTAKDKEGRNPKVVGNGKESTNGLPPKPITKFVAVYIRVSTTSQA